MEESTLLKYAREYVKAEQELVELKQRVKELEKVKSDAKAIFAKDDKIGTNGLVRLGHYIIKTWTQTTENIDKALLKEQAPDIYEKYRKADTVSQYARVTRAE